MIDMSDSETDLLPNNVLTFQNQGTTVCAKGPNINSTNISSLSFRNNTMTNMNMLYNMDRPRYAESICDPRSMSYRREREVSPMSCRSASGLQPRNFHHSYYPGGSSSHRSMYNGRGGSPMSVKSSRTIDSNTSMSAKDIAFAFQNGQFNKFDFKIIKEAYNKYMKSRLRRRVEKKRNIRMFLKGFRRRSGGDSGDQASNSSLSSDEDCRSMRSSRSALYKNRIPSCRSTITDMSQFRRAVRENDLVQDRTNNFRQNSFKNMFPVRHPSVKDTIQPKWQNTSVQKDRFKDNFLLPSQRFNQSVVSSFSDRPSRLASICEDNMLETRSGVSTQNKRQDNKKSNETDSEQDEIFGEETVMEKNNNGKRILEEDIPASDSKRTKRHSPPKSNIKPKTPKQNQVNTQVNTSMKRNSSDFVFAKPQLPIKKMGIVKNIQKSVKASKSQNKATSRKSEEVKQSTCVQSTDKVDSNIPTPPLSEEKLISSSLKVQEKLIAKSTQVLETEQSSSRLPAVDEQEKDTCLRAESTQFSTTDLSMRPSFIKRKLFSQKVDDTAKNSSSDSLQADSPQNNIYSKIQKEKNRARKLATQSCLNRDVGDDSNLLDLIHKVVPPDRMNVTAVNRSELLNNKSKPNNINDDKTDKWDVSSIISTCNNENVSDTYTDEDIFARDDMESHKQNKVTKQIRSDQNKTKGTESQKRKVEQKKDKLDAIPVTDKQNNRDKNNTSNAIEDKKIKIVVEKQSKQVGKHSKNIDDKQAINKNITAVSRGDKEEAFKHNKVASENQPVVETQTETLPEKQTKTLPEKVVNKLREQQTKALPEQKVNTLPNKQDKPLPVNKGKTLLQEAQVKTTTVKNKVGIQKQKTTVASKQNTVTAGKQSKAVEKQNKTVVDSQSAAPDKQSNLAQSQITPPKFLVVLQKLTPPDENERSPTDRNGLVKANVYKGVKSFWDTDTESEFEATPMKRTVPTGQPGSRPLGDHAMVDTVIEDISSVSQFIKSPYRRKLNVTLERLKTSKVAPVTQKTSKDTEHTSKQSSNKKEDMNSGKGTSKAPPKTTNGKLPVEIATHGNNRLNKTTSSTKENQPPTINTAKELTTKPKSKLNASQKSDNQSRMNDTLGSECRHLKVHNNTLRIRPVRARRAAGAGAAGRCCASPDTSGPAADDSSLYRSLRSRQVDLSTSLKAGDAEVTHTTLAQKPAPKNKRLTKVITKDKGETTLPSDISFTLTSDSAAPNRTLRNRRATAIIQQSNSDVSFTLVSDKTSVNDSTSSRRRRREVETLQINSESFFKTRKRSPLSKRILPENAANRSRSRR